MAVKFKRFLTLRQFSALLHILFVQKYEEFGDENLQLCPHGEAVRAVIRSLSISHHQSVHLTQTF